MEKGKIEVCSESSNGFFGSIAETCPGCDICKNVKKPVRVFNYPWHIAHQFELFKIPNTKWSWLTQHRRGYSSFPRGDYFEELDGTWVPHYEEGKYDFALLHLDQQCFEEGIKERGKGSVFFQIDKVIQDIPKVCLMHGTPYYPESFQDFITEEDCKEFGYTEHQVGMSRTLIDEFQKATKHFHTCVFNSNTSRLQWVSNVEGKEGYPKYKTIWHGMDPNEWFDLPKEPRVTTMISPAGLDKYYDRTFLSAVKDKLEEKDISLCHITVDASFKSWTEYRTFLGRSLIYFNPTRQSCMPRARAEAMSSGCCVITAGGQDVEEFIETGKNGIIVHRDPQFVADLIETLILDYKKALALGQEAKKTAQELFTVEKFHNNWLEIIADITGNKKDV